MPSTILMFSLFKNDWISIIFILLLLLLAVANTIFPVRFKRLVQMLNYRTYFNIYIKETRSSINLFNIIFLIINILSLSLIFFFTVRYFYGNTYDNFNTYFKITVTLSTFIIIKYLLHVIFDIIIFKFKKAYEFSFYKISFRNYSSIILIFLLVIHQYSIMSQGFTLIFSLVILTALYIVGYIYSSYKSIHKKFHNIYHIILYLCTLEIAPIMIYIKYIMHNAL